MNPPVRQNLYQIRQNIDKFRQNLEYPCSLILVFNALLLPLKAGSYVVGTASTLSNAIFLVLVQCTESFLKGLITKVVFENS
jgi:hypothetical protein